MNTTTLTVKTNQEAFDAVVRHLRTMPYRAYANQACCYWQSDGPSCAIGAITVNPQLLQRENTGVDWLISDGILDPGTVDLRLLMRLQTLHDTEMNWLDDSVFVEWDEAREIARTFRLSTAVLDEALVG